MADEKIIVEEIIDFPEQTTFNTDDMSVICGEPETEKEGEK